MIKWLFISAVLFTNGPKEIAQINRLKKDAEIAFNQRNFQLAIEKYEYLRDSLGVEEPNLLLNLAHSYFQVTDTASAKDVYASVAVHGPDDSKSIALQQLGVMAKHPQTLQESLQYLKSSLKSDPTNEGARYDYEVVKKLIEKQKEEQENQQEQNQDQQDQQEENQDQQDQQKQDQQNQQDGEQDEQQQDQQQQDQQEQQEKEGEEQEQQQQQEGEENQEQNQQEQSLKEKLEEMNISEEKAKMILEALRNNEIQYIQQQKRKAQKRPPSGKPDW